MNAGSGKRSDGSGSTFAMPAMIAALSLIGLVAALVGDGVFDLLSWVALGSVVGTIAWAISKPRK